MFVKLTPSLQKNAKVVSIDDYEDVPTNDEDALRKAVASQPIAVAIEGGGREFQLYSSVSVYITKSSFCYLYWGCLSNEFDYKLY